MTGIKAEAGNYRSEPNQHSLIHFPLPHKESAMDLVVQMKAQQDKRKQVLSFPLPNF